MDINGERDLQEWVSVNLDEVGAGGGVLDRLLEQGTDVTGLNAGSAPNDTERFVNAKAEWFWTVREIFENGEIDIDPDDEPTRCAARLHQVDGGLARPHQDRKQGRHAQAWTAFAGPSGGADHDVRRVSAGRLRRQP
jgi:hypothetical protein